ncbi:Membrane protein insertase YidC [Streptomyces sp. YIM 130001]|uniref:YidC/Oxa1 family membrane protein insertase n=1 Tax=Streptomyces sp. YIM 130001 TaxID=2259644 RepID=UPI000E65A8ED|nr:YidC/Oxa1 family membrane protein insertase [Streptomyces sp. YIM 130001]RII19707.1 Membrane protein insertase YidC [Streptomyces sp. YIM 130001]
MPAAITAHVSATSATTTLASPVADFFGGFADLVARLADGLEPVFHGSATAAAIVLFTMAVRLAVHPLSRAAARGQKERARLGPQLAELRKKHAKNPERLQKAVLELHTKEKVSPLSGCLPSLFQLPAFFLMYHVFSSSELGGGSNALLDHTLVAAPLGGRWHDALADGGVFGGAGLVYLALFALVAVVATVNYRRAKRQTAGLETGASEMPGMGAMAKVLPLFSFMTLVSVAVVPLAAALYIVTSTVWSSVERALLYRDMPAAAVTAAAA